jgi:hypothetical protein
VGHQWNSVQDLLAANPKLQSPAEKLNNNVWTAEEHRLFIQILKAHGEGKEDTVAWKDITALVKAQMWH